MLRLADGTCPGSTSPSVAFLHVSQRFQLLLVLQQLPGDALGEREGGRERERDIYIYTIIFIIMII